MAYVDVNTPVIDRITLPSGNTYYIADREIRDVVDILSQAIAGGVAYIVAWDGTAAPVIANIPEGVVVTYNGTTYTGTLSADSAQPGAFYLVKSATQAGGTLDVYDEYVPIGATGEKTWEKIGDTQIDLSNVVTNVTLTKQTDTVIGTDATFTITQPTVALSTGATAGTGVISVATGISSASASGDNVTALTGLGSPSTKSVIGASSTFTVTQPTVAIATDTTSGTGKVQVATGISSVSASGDSVTAVTGYASPTTDTVLTGVKVTTQPTVTLTANNSTATGRITYVQAQGTATTTKLSATASGGAVSASGDNVTALTGLGSPSTKNAIGASSTFTITQPTITLASNASTATGRVQVATGISSASASGDNVTALTGLGTPSTQNAVKSVTPTTKKLATTTITGVSGSTTPSVVQGRTSQTTATGGGTASTTNTDWLKGVSVSNGVLTIGAATLATQTTYSANAPGTITVPKAASSATTVATGSTTTTGSGADIVTDVAVGDTFAAVTGYASPTTDTVLGTASTITVTPSTTYLGATASGANTAWNSKDTVTAVTGYASPTTDTVLGTGSEFSVTDPTITIASGSTGDVTVATGIGAATTKYLSAAASGTAVGADGTVAAITGLGDPTTDTVLGTGSTITVTPSTTYIKATASGAGVAWNSKDAVSAVTGYASPTTDTVLGTGSTITVTPTTTNIKATASGANTAWNNKDSVTVLKSTTDVNVTKGS